MSTEKPVLDQTPLWRQLQATAQAVQAVAAGVSGSVAMESVEADLRPAVQSLAFRVWRNLGRAQALRKLLVNKLPAPPVDALLCTALALVWNDADAPYEAFTLVNQTVEAAKRSTATRAQANFVNACLRRFLRERGALVESTDKDPVAMWNHPRWWIERVRNDYPAHWQSILAAANVQAPLTLRVNARKTTAENYLQLLADAGISAVLSGPAAITLKKALPVQRLPGFDSGLVSVQDCAAQMAAPLLLEGRFRGQDARILDACAAPGGKTSHLLELSAGTVTALDIDPLRCARIESNLARLSLRARVLVADAAEPAAWWDGQQFDAILLDAPCTASGIVRRHPDVRWLRREADIAQLAALQKKMLSALWPLLKPQGYLLYCTCSVFHAEGQAQVQTFLVNNKDAHLQPSPGHLMPQNAMKDTPLIDNQLCDHDGFFYALLHKRGP